MYVQFLHSFYGAAVNVTAESYMPYWGEETVRDHDGSRTMVYRGSDYRLVKTIASVLNFTVRVIPTSSWSEVSCIKKRCNIIHSFIIIIIIITTTII